MILNTKEFMRRFDEWKNDSSRRKKQSFLDSFLFQDSDIPIPIELRERDQPEEDPNVLASDEIGDYHASLIRIDYRDRTHDYCIAGGDKNDPLSYMSKEDDFNRAARKYLSLLDYLKLRAVTSD